MSRLTQARDAELKYLREQNEVEISKTRDMADIETSKFKDMVDAIGCETIQAIANAGPQMQVRDHVLLKLPAWLIYMPRCDDKI